MTTTTDSEIPPHDYLLIIRITGCRMPITVARRLAVVLLELPTCLPCSTDFASLRPIIDFERLSTKRYCQ
ncbi:hypothetical protein M438DRAFT_109612 [Aureobasidium pullulans EXF-150]|uniref:Uncharacterized protein n=1 Tax=Aureobasidium pullulans EXF-150 TaxID=1043002 RepID=A0A074Y0Z0_AURPU|nr:uncharacterized protein M438DRAFT_109612 [Aureobasidium pullulans EXF-150]KEQ80561.1 hypothetical protein M438DRAFT_109612 [Aureobasidium pullulans EXF-150]